MNIDGWTEEQIQAWEAKHKQFATEERANAAADAWERENITPEVEAETQFWAEFYSREAEMEDKP